MLEANITSTVLFLKRLEIAGLRQCDFMDRPGLFTVPTNEGGAIGGGGCCGEEVRMDFVCVAVWVQSAVM